MGPDDGLEIDDDAGPSVEAFDAAVEDLGTMTPTLGAGPVAATADAKAEIQPDEGPTAMVDATVAGATAATTDDGANGSS